MRWTTRRSAFLGITAKCARCHDHKYDPLSQEEYYRFRSFFEPYEVRVDRVPGEVDTDKDGLSRIYDAELERPTYLLIRGDIQKPDKDRVLTPGVPRLFGQSLGKIEPVSLPIESYYPDHRPFVATDLIAKAKADIERAETELRKKQEEYAAVEKELRTPVWRPATRSFARSPINCRSRRKRLPPPRSICPRWKPASPPTTRSLPIRRILLTKALALAARKAERKAGILKADENVLRAQMEFNEALEQGCRGREEDRRSPETIGGGAKGADTGARRLQHHRQGLREQEHRAPHGAGALDRCAYESAHGQSRHQSHVAPAFRDSRWCLRCLISV